VFITPMPLLRLMAACGMPHLKNLDEAVSIMRSAMLDVIQVGLYMQGVDPDRLVTVKLGMMHPGLCLMKQCLSCAEPCWM
jgi:hypothetical protein